MSPSALRLLSSLLALLTWLAPGLPLLAVTAVSPAGCDGAACGCVDTSDGCCCTPVDHGASGPSGAPGDGPRIEGTDGCAPAGAPNTGGLPGTSLGLPTAALPTPELDVPDSDPRADAGRPVGESTRPPVPPPRG